MSDEGTQIRAGETAIGQELSGARFVGCDLTGVVIRGSDVAGLEIDSPWLFKGGDAVWVNGVDVVPLVEAELNRRFPGRELRIAADPDGLRAAWAAVEAAWQGGTQRATGMPAGSVDVRVAGEWSFAQTLRHLIMATDVWLGRAILERENPYHPIGLPNDDDGGDTMAYDPAVFSDDNPTFAQILAVRGDRQTMVRGFLAGATVEALAASRRNPHNPGYPETVMSCLHTILNEEWEHLRYALRDLDAQDASGASCP